MVLDIFVAIKNTSRMLYMFVSPCSQLTGLVRQEKKISVLIKIHLILIAT